MITLEFKNLSEAQKALDEELKQLKQATEHFVVVALQGVAANTMPYVPVDTSALINSEVRSVTKTAKGFEGRISYGADGAAGAMGTPVQEYAIYVHDGPQKNWQKPGASNQYLLKGVQDFIRDDLPRLIQFFGAR